MAIIEITIRLKPRLCVSANVTKQKNTAAKEVNIALPGYGLLNINADI
jgi:hypothetical protein